MVLRLDGPQIGALRDLLDQAFAPNRFDDLLRYRLNKRLHHFAGAHDDHLTVLRKVIETANAELWWRDLLREARNAVPADPELLALAEQMGQAPTIVTPTPTSAAAPVHGKELELKIKAARSSFDILTWRRRLGEIESRVCRVEYPETEPQGTGFLVGPDLVLTNFHVIEAVKRGEVAPGQVVLRFDFKVLADGVTVAPGKSYRLAAGTDWLADQSPYSKHDTEVQPTGEPKADELDYALLHVAGRPGDDPVGGDTLDPQPTPRGWIKLPATPHDFKAQPALYIVQHSAGKPMQVALDTEAVLGVNDGGTRVRYTTETEPGSSGSPCFGPDWQWVALHHAGDPKYWKQAKKPGFNQGIPVLAIAKLLADRGKIALLGGG